MAGESGRFGGVDSRAVGKIRSTVYPVIPVQIYARSRIYSSRYVSNYLQTLLGCARSNREEKTRKFER